MLSVKQFQVIHIVLTKLKLLSNSVYSLTKTKKSENNHRITKHPFHHLLRYNFYFHAGTLIQPSNNFIVFLLLFFVRNSLSSSNHTQPQSVCSWEVKQKSKRAKISDLFPHPVPTSSPPPERLKRILILGPDRVSTTNKLLRGGELA